MSSYREKYSDNEYVISRFATLEMGASGKDTSGLEGFTGLSAGSDSARNSGVSDVPPVNPLTAVITCEIR